MRSLLALAAFTFVSTPAFAETVHYTANLTGGAEAPPTDSKGTG
ncbi:MAG: CHRD domain-containing protein, partial [Hyphomicrobiales bacterium]|nr:CHRD domain-containing protein [Hyphomicrobiales bacterium]